MQSSKVSSAKAKIQYTTATLSAYAIGNLVNALGLDIPVTKFAKPPAPRSEFYNVELKVGESSFYGELTIISYLLSIKNQD